jgi:hypothetical protein
MKVTVSKRPSDQAIKNFTKLLLEIIEQNNLYDKYLPQKASK